MLFDLLMRKTVAIAILVSLNLASHSQAKNYPATSYMYGIYLNFVIMQAFSYLRSLHCT